MDRRREGRSGWALRNFVAVAALIAAVAVSATGCKARATSEKSTDVSGGKPAVERELTLIAYSVPKKAYEKIIPAFQTYWKQKTGEDVTFKESYGASGAQSRAVIDGLDADVVHLAMEPDVAKIAEAGLITYDWQKEAPGNGVPQTSLIILGVRPGNPKGISDWSDASASGIKVITPDPKSSGGAKWNLLASWGQVAQNGGSEDAAYKQVLAFYKNAVVLDKSARDASNTFLRKGIGDAAALWESDANIAKSEGGQLDIVVPKSTILAETAAAVVNANSDKKGNTAAAKAFVEFLFTSEAQEAFAEAGIRPVDEVVLAEYADKFPKPSGKLFTIAEFGGWKAADAKFFDDGTTYDRIAIEVAKTRK